MEEHSRKFDIHCTISLQVSKCVEDVSQFSSRQLLRLIVSSIDCPVVNKSEVMFDIILEGIPFEKTYQLTK